MDGVLPRHTKPGTAPGTLAGRAPVPDEALDFTLVEYTPEKCEVLHGVEDDEFHGNQRSKLDIYGNQGFIVLNDPTYEDGEIKLRQVSIFFGENYVISFHEHKLDVFKPVRDRLQTSGSRLRTFGIDYLVYALIDLVVDRKFPLIEALANQLEMLEDEALGHPEETTLGSIHQAR